MWTVINELNFFSKKWMEVEIMEAEQLFMKKYEMLDPMPQHL